MYQTEMIYKFNSDYINIIVPYKNNNPNIDLIKELFFEFNCNIQIEQNNNKTIFNNQKDHNYKILTNQNIILILKFGSKVFNIGDPAKFIARWTSRYINNKESDKYCLVIQNKEFTELIFKDNPVRIQRILAISLLNHISPNYGCTEQQRINTTKFIIDRFKDIIEQDEDFNQQAFMTVFQINEINKNLFENKIHKLDRHNKELYKFLREEILTLVAEGNHFLHHGISSVALRIELEQKLKIQFEIDLIEDILDNMIEFRCESNEYGNQYFIEDKYYSFIRERIKFK